MTASSRGIRNRASIARKPLATPVSRTEKDTVLKLVLEITRLGFCGELRQETELTSSSISISNQPLHFISRDDFCSCNTFFLLDITGLVDFSGA